MNREKLDAPSQQIIGGINKWTPWLKGLNSNRFNNSGVTVPANDVLKTNAESFSSSKCFILLMYFRLALSMR